MICESGQPRVSATSEVVGLTVAGNPVGATDRVDIPLPLGLGVLHLNHTSPEGNGVVVRALWLETALGNVIVGEARAGFTGNPCAPGGGSGERAGSVTIVIETTRYDQDFNFTGGLGPFSLNGSLGTDRRTFSPTPGSYEVTASPVGPFRVTVASTGAIEAFPWRLESVACFDPDGGSTFDLRQRRVTVDLDRGEDVVCTFRLFNAGVLANTSGGVVNPSLGVSPGADRQDSTDRDSAGRDSTTPSPPPPPAIPSGEGGPSRQGGQGGQGRSSGGNAAGGILAVVGILLLALLGGLWLFLVAAKRRKDNARV